MTKTQIKKILVTGSNGLLGQAISKVFEEESDFDLLLTSIEDRSFVRSKYQYQRLDITNRKEIREIVNSFNPEVIVNCAAFTDVDKCETEKVLCWKLNVDAVKNLILAARPRRIKLVHYSTDYIFDGKNGPYSEDAIPSPISFYGRSKLASENAIYTSGINFLIIRTMILFGKGENVKPNFALWLVEKLRNREPVYIADDMYGNSTHVSDLAYGTLKAIEKNVSGVYNIAGADIKSRYEFAITLCEVFGFDKRLINRVKTKDLNLLAHRPLKSGLITLKAVTELGFKPMDTLESLRLLKYELEDKI
ncbi:MAG: SDR family oxidoreductase [Ignavibacteria bacterium]